MFDDECLFSAISNCPISSFQHSVPPPPYIVCTIFSDLSGANSLCAILSSCHTVSHLKHINSIIVPMAPSFVAVMNTTGTVIVGFLALIYVFVLTLSNSTFSLIPFILIVLPLRVIFHSSLRYFLLALILQNYSKIAPIHIKIKIT